MRPAVAANSGPGYRKDPDHRVATAPADGRLRVTFNGEVVADTRAAIRMDEGTYAAVYYVPRNDVKIERLSRTAHRTYCPFKGDASYFTLSSGSRTEINAVWSYESPYDEVVSIKDHLAFYPNKVDSSEFTPA